MPTDLRRILRRTLYDLRGGFQTRPLAIALALAALGEALPAAEARVPLIDRWARALPVLAPRDPATAQAILGVIAGGVMTVVSIILSVLLVALTLASAQFSPRLLAGFVQDRLTQYVIGIFLGTFLYCVCAYPAARVVPVAVVPAAAVLAALALTVLCAGALLLFIHHIARSINASYIADRIARETERIVDAVLPHPLRGPLMPETPAEPLVGAVTLVSETSGYIRFIDLGRLVALAREHHVVVEVLRRVGHFAAEGTALLRVSRADRLDPAATAEVLASFDIGPTRTLEQDVEFGVLQLVDVALKAISPAVNDPGTAINCIDQLGRVLVRVVSRRPAPGALYHPPGTLRVMLRPLSFTQLLSALTQIRRYGSSDMAVSLRLLRALTDAASATREPTYLAPLRDHARRVVAGCRVNFPAEEHGELDARLATLLRLTEGAPEYAVRPPGA